MKTILIVVMLLFCSCRNVEYVGWIPDLLISNGYGDIVVENWHSYGNDEFYPEVAVVIVSRNGYRFTKILHCSAEKKECIDTSNDKIIKTKIEVNF